MESKIERYFIKRAKKQRALTFKFVSPGNAGVPDRLVIHSTGKVEFVELKAPGEVPRPLQVATFVKLANHGQTVTIIDSKDGVDRFWKVTDGC